MAMTKKMKRMVEAATLLAQGRPRETVADLIGVPYDKLAEYTREEQWPLAMAFAERELLTDSWGKALQNIVGAVEDGDLKMSQYLLGFMGQTMNADLKRRQRAQAVIGDNPELVEEQGMNEKEKGVAFAFSEDAPTPEEIKAREAKVQALIEARKNK